ncbi:MAG: glycerol-3-phosphate acyltransferase, partial [Candidatus Eremiobacteraeota bacterium]|nr:glycerol-3-phosphate acyltransferase [Candidatus Eremiobacteraeota bacterium]
MSGTLLASLVVFGFLLGSLPTGLLVARVFFATDIRAAGSGNIGAANALRTLGRGAGALVLVVDALKGFIPALVGLEFSSVTLAAAAAFAAIVGHCYSPWLRGRGGKGVATALGALFALCWPAALAFIAVWIPIVAASGYASLGSLTATALAAVPLWFFLGARGAIYG